MEEYKSLLEMVGVFIAGGGLWKIWDAYRNKRTQDVDEFEKVIKQWQDLHNEVKENERKCEERYERMSILFREMQDKDKEMRNKISELSMALSKLKKDSAA